MVKAFGIFLIFFLTLFPSLSFTQKYPFRNYLEKSGLPSPFVFCTFQDSMGYIWMGYSNGLSRFDGVDYKIFKKKDGLPDNKINVIYEDNKRNIWIGTLKGAIIYSMNDGIFRSPGQEILDKNNIFSIIKDKQNNLWIGTHKGLVLFNGDGFKHFSTENGLHNNLINSISPGKEGELWIGGVNSGITCFNTKEYRSFFTLTSKDGLLSDYVSSLYFDSKERLWIGTENGLNCYSNGVITSYTKEEGLCFNNILKITEDASNNIWIGTWNGASLISNGKFSDFSTLNGLPNNVIYSIMPDREGNIWFGTHGGLSYLTSLNIKFYSKSDGLQNEMVFDMLQDHSGRYWFGTSEGLSCYDGEKFVNYLPKDGLNDNNINSVMIDRKGDLWIGTKAGISVLSSGKFKKFNWMKKFENSVIFDIIEKRDGTIWVGSKDGIFYLKNSEFIPFFPDRIKRNATNLLEAKNGTFWFSADDEIFYYSNKGLNSLTKKYGISLSHIFGTYEDSKGKLWIGKEDGLICYYKGKIKNYSPMNSSLFDYSCFSIIEDNKGLLWIATPWGFSCYDGKDFKNYPTERIGLTRRAWQKGFKDNNGYLWFSSTEGVISFYPPLVKPVRVPPPIYITGVKVMEKDIPFGKNNIFDSEENIIRFYFNGICYTDPKGVTYKYRMENIDKEWKNTRDRSLFYPFLPPGKYAFKVKAVNSDGFESTEPAEYSFEILPPFWQTWWFVGLSILVFISFLGLAVHWRMRRVREKAELKEKNRQLIISQRMELMGTLAAGTVHDLKNLLAVIIGYSRMMSHKYQSGTDADNENYQNLEIIKNTASTAAQMAKQILSFARHKKQLNELEDLGTSLSEILETIKVTQPKNIKIEYSPPSESILLSIQPARFQQVIMNICLNAFDAMPMGGCLSISLSKGENSEILLKISDTGTGIDKENLQRIFDPLFTTKSKDKGTGLGLFVVKQIINEYNGEIEAYSEPGKGTMFIIRFH